MSDQIQDWIDEARRLGNNIHDHVAERAWGTVNVTTRNKAKSLVFSHLYGGSPAPAMSGEFNEYADCPFMDIPTTVDSWLPAAQQQAIDRINRVREFKVKVFTDADITPNYAIYTVMATSEIDARSIAFLLDGGCEPGLTNFDAGHIELVKTWTEVIE